MFDVEPSLQREIDVALTLYTVGLAFLVLGGFVVPDPLDASGVGLICILGGLAKFAWGLKKHHPAPDVT